MSIEAVKVPVLAESVADATIVKWYKQVGEAVREGDKLVDVETDKIVLEVVAPKTGVLSEILKGHGETVLSDEIIAKVDTEATATAVPATSKTKTPKPATKAEKAKPEPEAKKTTAAKTSPAVRKIAADQGIDPASVPHSGDRVTKADMLQAEASTEVAATTATVGVVEAVPVAETAPVAPVTIAAPTLPVPLPEETTVAPAPASLDRPEERVPMTRLRKRIAERLLAAQQEHAILTTFNEINMRTVTDVRNKYKEAFEKKHGIKLGFMSFFTKAVVVALQRFPIINASTEGDDIIYHGYYDIGIAVSSPRGLVVPILRNVDTMSFATIEKNIAELAKRAKDAQLSIEDLTGGTFSITNGGIFGSMMSTPILNPPQSAILGMHNVVDRPVVENGEIVIRPIMYVALSYDHRLIDGRDAVQFLFTIKTLIEDPARLLLEV